MRLRCSQVMQHLQLLQSMQVAALVQCIIGWKGVGVTTCTGQGGSGYTTGSAQCNVYGTIHYSAVWGISLNAVLVGDEGTGTKISQSFAAS